MGWILWRCQLLLTKINEHNASEKILVCAKSLAQCELCYDAGRPSQLIQFFQGFEHMPPKEKQYRAQFQRINFLQKIPKLQLFYTIKASISNS